MATTVKAGIAAVFVALSASVANLEDANSRPDADDSASHVPDQLGSRSQLPDKGFEEAIYSFRQTIMAETGDDFVQLRLPEHQEFLELALLEASSIDQTTIETWRRNSGLDRYEGSSIRVSRVAHSRQELLDAHEAFDRLAIDAGFRFSRTKPDWFEGTISVWRTAEQEAEFPHAEFESTAITALGLIPIEFEVVDAEYTAASTRDSWPPYKGGRRISLVGNGNCTAGFSVWVRDGEPGAGEKRGTTAGHCGEGGLTVRTGLSNGTWTETMGTSARNTFFPNDPTEADAQLVVVSTDQDNIGREVLIEEGTGTSYTGRVVSRTQTNSLTPGTSISMSGQTSGWTAGFVVDYPITVSYSNFDGHTVRNLMEWTGTAAGGDSGAPMFQNIDDGDLSAVGMHVAGCRGDGCDYENALQPMGIVEEHTTT